MRSALHEPSLNLEDAQAKIEHLDSYFKECEEIGQGINTKETVWMTQALVYALQNGGSPLQVLTTLTSESGQGCLHRAIDKALPGFRKLFA